MGSGFAPVLVMVSRRADSELATRCVATRMTVRETNFRIPPALRAVARFGQIGRVIAPDNNEGRFPQSPRPQHRRQRMPTGEPGEDEIVLGYCAADLEGPQTAKRKFGTLRHDVRPGQQVAIRLHKARQIIVDKKDAFTHDASRGLPPSSPWDHREGYKGAKVRPSLFLG